MLRPAYRIVIGDHTVDTTVEPRASTAVTLTVELDMDTPADGCTLVQGQVGGLAAAPGDAVSVDLGYADAAPLVRVFTGVVTAVSPSLRHKRITACSGADALLRARSDRTFEGTTAGGIVRALAADAGMSLGRVDDGPALPAYVVDGRRSSSRHIRDLADLAGFDTYLTAAAELVFAGIDSGRTVHALEYAEQVLAVELDRGRPAAATVQVWGESPGRGENSWAWLTKDFGPRHGEAGSGPPVLLVQRPVVRSAQVAASVATALGTALTDRSVAGRVRIAGRAQVALGDLVRLSGFPSVGGVDEIDGTYQVRGVAHRLTKRDGFVTDIRWRSLPAGIGGP